MKKRLHTDAISNELKGASLFFTRPPAPSTPPPEAAPPTPDSPPSPQSRGGSHGPATPRASDRTPERATGGPGERPPVPSPGPKPRRRQARRYSFEIFEDQIERIKRLALEDQLRGGDLNQSAIARAALDRHLDALERGG
jgi:hypothetical protein